LNNNILKSHGKNRPSNEIKAHFLNFDYVLCFLRMRTDVLSEEICIGIAIPVLREALSVHLCRPLTSII